MMYDMSKYPIGLIPGPVHVPQSVREAWLEDLGSPDLEPAFFELYRENQSLIRELLGTKESVVFTVGEAMSILWGGLKSALREGERLLAVSSGIFGEGFADMARSIGADALIAESPYNDIPDPSMVREAAIRYRPKVISVVHCETPSGTITPLRELGEVAREAGALFLVDFVSSGGGTPVDVDANLIDIGLLGSQKALSLPPSLSITTLSERAWDVFKEVDYNGYDAFMPWRSVPDAGSTPYTHDWHGMIALNTSLSEMKKEGFQNVYARHNQSAEICRRMGREMGLELFPVSEEICSPTVTAFNVPSDRTWEELDRALRERGIAVGGNYCSLAGKVFRIGHMGSQARPELITKAMEIIKEVLKR